MTAGKGVVHTERTPDYLRNGKINKMHGFQIWVALPVAYEDIAPTFQHVPSNELPMWTKNHIEYTLVSDKAFGKESPLKVYSKQFMLELKNKMPTTFSADDTLKGEIGICIVEGGIVVDEEEIGKGNMLVSKKADWCHVDILPNSHLLIFGGEPFEEERFIHWNFVASTKEKIEDAKKRWLGDGFELIEGEGPKIPLP